MDASPNRGAGHPDSVDNRWLLHARETRNSKTNLQSTPRWQKRLSSIYCLAVPVAFLLAIALLSPGRLAFTREEIDTPRHKQTLNQLKHELERTRALLADCQGSDKRPNLTPPGSQPPPMQQQLTRAGSNPPPTQQLWELTPSHESTANPTTTTARKKRKPLDPPSHRLPGYVGSCKLCWMCSLNETLPPAEPGFEVNVSAKECATCHSCSHTLQQLNILKSKINFQMGGEKFSIYRFTGATHSSVFRSTSSTGRRAILKVHGVDTRSDLVYYGRHYLTTERPAAVGFNWMLQQCALADLMPSLWLEDVRAVDTRSGHVIIEPLAVFQDEVSGISLFALQHNLGLKHARQVTSILRGVKSESVIRLAVFDVLMSNGDTQEENVLFQPDGSLRIIDGMDTSITNDRLFGRFQDFPVNSIFLPGTWYYGRNRFGSAFVNGGATYNASKNITPNNGALGGFPALTMDYRCHTPQGTIGTAYPPALRAAMQTVVNMTTEALWQNMVMDAVQDGPRRLQKEARNLYTVRMQKNLEVLQKRAADMLEKGFEAVLAEVDMTHPFADLHPLQDSLGHWPVAEPCCAVEKNAGKQEWECLPKWPDQQPLQ